MGVQALQIEEVWGGQLSMICQLLGIMNKVNDFTNMLQNNKKSEYEPRNNDSASSDEISESSSEWDNDTENLSSYYNLNIQICT